MKLRLFKFNKLRWVIFIILILLMPVTYGRPSPCVIGCNNPAEMGCVLAYFQENNIFVLALIQGIQDSINCYSLTLKGLIFLLLIFNIPVSFLLSYLITLLIQRFYKK